MALYNPGRTSRNIGLGLDSRGLGQVREVEADKQRGVRITNSNMYLANQAHQMARMELRSAQLRSMEQRQHASHQSSSVDGTKRTRNAQHRPTSLARVYHPRIDDAVDDRNTMSGKSQRSEAGVVSTSEQVSRVGRLLRPANYPSVSGCSLGSIERTVAALDAATSVV